ncbi:MFS transporter [Aquibacillus koreensis]|uniref:MFS transporter n=1 Tax=Aquibacillus koreensis TaxID=279446 RepID=A0A9X3WMG8_9BACI|nr:MFS transporter [Aquibacillus koreensis]MCT2536761.1 MFS transporter [Aquibacillus koreensis]MDC3421483.1 MFS transporter [Aquibacillus koreensis]
MSNSINTKIQDYVDDPIKQQQLYKRTLIVIVIAQIFGGAGLAAGITVGALLAEDMLGADSFAGIPIALFTLGSAGAALLVGNLSHRFGRRPGLAIGFITGGIGALTVVIAAITNNVILLFVSLFIYGAGTATNLQARYAGTDLATSKQRGTAVSIALVATTFGAVAGPILVDVMGEFALSIGVPALAGPFILAGVAFILAGLMIFILLRPDPLKVAEAIAIRRQNQQEDRIGKNTEIQPINKRGVIAGTTIMVVTQIVMVAVMTMTPVHMGDHGHGLNQVGLIIGIHIGAMYLPSLVTGMLVDKFGRKIMAITSGATLLVAGALAAFAPTDSLVVLTIALALLGLGWNFGLISGTALIVDATPPSKRAKTQGAADVFIALAGASGGALAGIVVAHSSFTVLSLGGGILSLILVPVVFMALRNN